MAKGWIQTVPLAILVASMCAPLAQWVQPSQEIKAGIYALLAKDGALFAGTDGQGAFRSRDRGTTWEAINVGFPERPGVYSFSGFGGRLLAGTYNGVYHSTDNGDNWIQSNHDNWQAKHVVALAGNGKYLFATSSMEYLYPYNKGIYRSADSGLTWTRVTNGFTAIYWINTLAQHQGALYVGTSGQGVFRSTDNGDVWTPFNTGLQDISDTDPRCFFSKENRLYAGSNDGIYVLAGGNNSWTRISRGLPEFTLITSIVAYENHLFAGSANQYGGGIFHSANEGSSWRRVAGGESQPSAVASLAVMGDELFASTGEVTCGELGCNGSMGGVWKVSLPRLLGTTAIASRPPDAGQIPWEKVAHPLDAFDAIGRRMTRGPAFIRSGGRGWNGNPAQ